MAAKSKNVIERMQISKGAKALEWQEMKKLLKHLEQDENYKFALLLLLGCSTGFRISDLLRLEWSQVLDKTYLTLAEKKTGKARTTKIPLAVQTLIRKYYRALNPKYEPCFAGRSGSAFTSQYVNKQLKYIKAKYPIEHEGQFSTHTFRKTYGKRLYDQAEDKSAALIHISKILNHSSVEITREYIGIVAQDIEEMLDNIW